MTTVDVSIRLDPRWVEVPLDEESDLGEWSRRAVDDGLATRRRDEAPAIREALAQGLAQLADSTRRRAVGMGGETLAAWVLAPGEDFLPVTVAKLDSALLSEGTTLEQAADEAMAPESERFGDPVVTEMSTANGRTIRVKQLIVVPAPGPDDGSEQQSEQHVYTVVVYLWLGPTAESLLLVKAWFSSPVDAELAEEALDQLASSLTTSVPRQ